MEKTKRYYWIKLKTDFFNLAEIDFLLSQKFLIITKRWLPIYSFISNAMPTNC